MPPLSPRKFIIGNWKMNGLSASLVEARAIAQHATQCPQVDVALCPPVSLLATVHRVAPNLRLGGQECHQEQSGAYTGCISAAMLADAGAQFVLIGHSERRQYFGEDEKLLTAKITAARAAGLDVILCVGEPQAVREAGQEIPYVLAQLAVIASIAPESCARLTIAYEPIWAIGTGLTAGYAQITIMHRAIRGALRECYGVQGDALRILYGGSVTAENAAVILKCGDVDGALVGGASLSAATFLPIIDSA